MMIESDDAMRALGEKLGSRMAGGECIELVGDVGSGKTTLTKGIAKGLGVSETVQSPTFTINRTYDSPSGIRLSHYDFYRLSDPGIMSEELAESLEQATTSIVIEWGDIVADILPKDHLRINFESPQETTRILSLDAYGESSSKLLEALA